MCLFCADICEVCQHWYRCAHCGIKLDIPLDIIMGKRCCDRCNNRLYTECEDCGELIYTGGYDGAWYCPNCSVGCDHCDCKPTHSFDGNDVCLECLQDYYCTCDNCGELVHEDNTCCDDCTVLCEPCYNRDYFTCCSCHCIVHCDYAYERNDDYYCGDCYGETGESVTSDTFNIIKTDRWFGVEIEACKAYGRADSRWAIVSEHCGVEYVSPLLQGDAGLDFIRELYSDIKPKVNGYCGLHVHIDVRDLTEDQLLMLVRAFRTNKELFYSRVSPERHTNTFCKHAIPYIREEDDWHSYMGRISGTRYRWINLQSVSKHGSIEVRLHEATEDSDKVVEWVVFLMTFVETVLSGDGSYDRMYITERMSCV